MYIPFKRIPSTYFVPGVISNYLIKFDPFFFKIHTQEIWASWEGILVIKVSNNAYYLLEALLDWILLKSGFKVKLSIYFQIFKYKFQKRSLKKIFVNNITSKSILKKILICASFFRHQNRLPV